MAAILQMTIYNAFLNEKVKPLIKMLLWFVCEGTTKNFPAFVKITAWRRPGDNPLTELMMAILLVYSMSYYLKLREILRELIGQ